MFLRACWIFYHKLFCLTCHSKNLNVSPATLNLWYLFDIPLSFPFKFLKHFNLKVKCFRECISFYCCLTSSSFFDMLAVKEIPFQNIFHFSSPSYYVCFHIHSMWKHTLVIVQIFDFLFFADLHVFGSGIIQKTQN